MDNIQLDGVFSFMDNIKNIKIGDEVILIINKNNKISKNAVGVYTLTKKKLGYIPYTCDQINIDNKFIINKICLNKSNLQILISCEYNKFNMISLDEYINDYNLDIKEYDFYKNDIFKLKKKLVREGFLLNDLIITYINEWYINIQIEFINDNKIEKKVYYTVTKKYYDKNILIYNEFFKYCLIKNNIYEIFKIHRLEFYIFQNYKLLNNINKIKKYIDLNNYTIKIDIIKIGELKIDIDVCKKKLCFDHELKIYFNINLFSYLNNEDSIIELENNLIHNNLHIMKAIISNKLYLIYNLEFIKKIEIFKNKCIE